MDFPSERVNYGYLKVFIVAQATVPEMLCKLFAVSDSFKIAFKVGPDPVSHRDAVFSYRKRIFASLYLKSLQHIEDRQRGRRLWEKGLPGFRALARLTVVERFR